MLEILPQDTLILACFVALLAGLVKGMVGFAMPTVMISGLSAMMAPEVALAALMIPTLVSNVWQAFRQGYSAAFRSMKGFWLFLCVGGVVMALTAQLVPLMSASTLLLLIGVPVLLFAASQLAGLQFTLSGKSVRTEVGFGMITGAIGGMSGVWGPPTVMYLTGLGTAKQDQVRFLGVAFGLGAVVLVVSHLHSGVLRAETALLSGALLVPALTGMWMGLMIQDRINQDMFRKATLAVLLLAGANLIRRGLIG